MNYSNETIGSALPIYGQHLAEATGIKVVVKGHSAFTDGQTVNVPMVVGGDARLAFGFMAHECSHVRNTDMTVFNGQPLVPIKHMFLNILEDIRIERLSMDQYPGTEEDLRYLNRKVLLEPFKEDNMGTSVTEIVHGALLFGAYWKLQEPQLEVPGKAYIAALEGLIGESLADQIMNTAYRCLDCTNTQEVLVLVDEILAMIPNQKEPEQPEPDQDDSEEESDQDEESGADNSGGNDSSDDSPESDGDDSFDAGEEGQDQSAGEGNGGSSSNPEEGSTDSDGSQGSSSPAQQEQGASSQGIREQLLSATEEDLAGLISDVGDEAGKLINAEAQCNGVESVLPLEGRTTLRDEGRSLMRVHEGSAQSAGLRQVISGLLQSKVDTRVRLKRQGRCLDTSRIAMLRTGESRVFRSKARAIKESAAVQILLDKSWSMNTSMDTAEAAVYAVLRSLEGLPLVTTGAMSFPEGNHRGEVGCSLIKAHNESLNAAVQSRAFGAEAQGGTPLGDAIWPAAAELYGRKARGAGRKILIIITDGRPDNTLYAQKMVKRCEASGISVIGLGFGGATDVVLSSIFSKYCCVGTVDQLRTSLFGVVRGALAA